jgi:hypothetical protein
MILPCVWLEEWGEPLEPAHFWDVWLQTEVGWVGRRGNICLRCGLAPSTEIGRTESEPPFRGRGFRSSPCTRRREDGQPAATQPRRSPSRWCDNLESGDKARSRRRGEASPVRRDPFTTVWWPRNQAVCPLATVRRGPSRRHRPLTEGCRGLPGATLPLATTFGQSSVCSRRKKVLEQNFISLSRLLR